MSAASLLQGYGGPATQKMNSTQQAPPRANSKTYGTSTQSPVETRTSSCWETCCCCCYCCCKAADAVGEGVATGYAIEDLSNGNQGVAGTYIDVSAISGDRTAQNLVLLEHSGDISRDCTGCAECLKTSVESCASDCCEVVGKIICGVLEALK